MPISVLTNKATSFPQKIAKKSVLSFVRGGLFEKNICMDSSEFISRRYRRRTGCLRRYRVRFAQLYCDEADGDDNGRFLSIMPRIPILSKML